MTEPSTVVTSRGVRLIIRPACDEDVVALVRVALAAFVPNFRSFQAMLGPAVYRLISPDWQASQTRAVETLCHGREHHECWVAEVDGVPVGMIAAHLNLNDRTGEMHFLVVDPAHQSRGIGTALTTYALDQMKEKGVRLARVETGADPSHAAGRRVYEKAGCAAMPLVRYFKDL
jgi:ribosomal protein S18 acetylase RimI-like enzyme